MHPQVMTAVIVLAALILTAGCISSFIPAGERADYPSIDDVETGEGTIPVEHVFSFQDRELTIPLSVDTDLYADAAGSRKSVVLYGDWDDDEEWVIGSYQAFACDPRLEELYGSLRSALSGIRTSMGLTDDEYLELMAAYAQSMIYESPEGEQTPRFPVETIVEGRGDCDDTSILLAGLLAREGYDAVLFYFEEENHMAVGVRGPGEGFMATGYEYIETTGYRLPGVPTEELQNGMTLASRPLLIPIGGGTLAYGAGDESRRIDAAAKAAREYAAAKESELEEIDAAVTSRYDEIADIRDQLEDAARQGNTAKYNRLVREHNQAVEAYNALLAEYDRLYADYEAYAGLNNYIAGHQYDRPGTSVYIREWTASTGLPLFS